MFSTACAPKGKIAPCGEESLRIALDFTGLLINHGLEPVNFAGNFDGLRLQTCFAKHEKYVVSLAKHRDRHGHFDL